MFLVYLVIADLILCVLLVQTGAFFFYYSQPRRCFGDLEVLLAAEGDAAWKSSEEL